MLSKEAINDFLKDWYTIEEIEKINQWLKDIEEWNLMSF